MAALDILYYTHSCPLFIRRFAHLLLKKDISSPEVKKDLLRRVKNAISSTAERFSGYMQNVRFFFHIAPCHTAKKCSEMA